MLLTFVWEKGKTLDFSETIVVYVVKVGRCSLLNEFMNQYEYQRSTCVHWPWSKVTQIQTFSNFFSLETARLIEAKFHVELPWDWGTKVYTNGPGHMTNLAAKPINGKTHKKFSSLEPKGWWSWKLVCSTGYSITTKFVQMMTLGYLDLF